jgi:hypothetical protein
MPPEHGRPVFILGEPPESLAACINGDGFVHFIVLKMESIPNRL